MDRAKLRTWQKHLHSFRFCFLVDWGIWKIKEWQTWLRLGEKNRYLFSVGDSKMPTGFTKPFSCFQHPCFPQKCHHLEPSSERNGQKTPPGGLLGEQSCACEGKTSPGFWGAEENQVTKTLKKLEAGDFGHLSACHLSSLQWVTDALGKFDSCDSSLSLNHWDLLGLWASKQLFKAMSTVSPMLEAPSGQWSLLLWLIECGTNVESHTQKGLKQNLINAFILSFNSCSLFHICEHAEAWSDWGGLLSSQLSPLFMLSTLCFSAWKISNEMSVCASH